MTIDQARIRTLATPLLVAARNAGAEAASTFKPRPEDFARVFGAEIVELATRHYQQLWEQRVEITARPDQTDLLLVSATSAELKETSTFPGGYKALSPQLVSDRVWLAWKYVRPGEQMGMAYDGLVWLDDRFAWFPKPWRILPKSADPFYVD